jgi:hypothetical protein
MQAVLKHEALRAETDEETRKITDVSERDVGYDVESFDRLVEVKSFKVTGSVRLTSHERETTKRVEIVINGLLIRFLNVTRWDAGFKVPNRRTTSLSVIMPTGSLSLAVFSSTITTHRILFSFIVLQAV